MQRRDARSFLEEVLLKVPDLTEEAREALLELANEKPGTKRASKLAAAIAQNKGPSDA